MAAVSARAPRSEPECAAAAVKVGVSARSSKPAVPTKLPEVLIRPLPLVEPLCLSP